MKTQIHYAIGASSLGLVLVACSEKGICAVFLSDDSQELERELRNDFPDDELIEDEGKVGKLLPQVIRQVDSPSKTWDIPLDPRGTRFQHKVWQALRKIPMGSTSSYMEIAVKIGLPTGARAVARACATNPVSILIPCHRVLASDGKLTGYRWRVERKQKLLEKEGALKS